jgi:adenylate kinase
VQKTHPEVNRYNLLNFPKTTRDAWYKVAFENVLNEKLEKDSINVVNLHLTYWWKDGPDEVVKANILSEFLEALDPIFYIQIIDSAEAIKRRLDPLVEYVGRSLSLEDIYRWQDMECFVGGLFASINGKKFYIIPTRQSPDILYRLIFTKDPKVYLSFPMFHADKKIRDTIEKFYIELNKVAIVFNPEKSEEYSHYSGRLRRISGDATVKKDYRLIAQSDIVVAFFPKIVHSSGVISEINFATSIGKTVYLIWPSKNYSPFTSYPVHRIFFSPRECIEEIKKLKK